MTSLNPVQNIPEPENCERQPPELPKGGLRENVLWLTALQGLNYLLPLATVPYLIRVLGPGSYGILAFSITLSQYLVVLCDYGFNLSATREIAVQREHRDRLEMFISSVLVIKVCLMALSALLLGVFLLCVRKYAPYSDVIMVAFLGVVGSVAFPVWLFQGLQDMRLVAVLSSIGKIICTAAIFITVHSSRDVLIAVLWTVSGLPISGVVAWIVIRTRYRLALRLPSPASLKYALRSSFHIFLSSTMSTALTNGAILIMGFIAPLSAVGIYAAIEKIAKAGAMGFAPLTQALYPRTAEHFAQGRRNGAMFVLRSGLVVISLAIVASVVLLVAAKWIVALICGPAYVPYYGVLRVLSVWILLGVVNNILGIQYLLGSGHDKGYSICLMITAAATFILLFLLVPAHLYIGAALAITLGEGILTLLMAVVIVVDWHKAGISPPPTLSKGGIS